MTTFIAQLSDSHITTGALGAGPATGLQLALARVMGLDPRPDCVVITGDLTDHGRPDEYAALKEIIGDFPLPLHLVTGNHDCRGPLLDAFGGRPYYAVEYPAFTFVALDSLVEGSPAGRLGAAQLSWLDDVLRGRPDVPALIGLHHPPMPVGIRFLDGMRLLDGDALREVVAAHGNVARVMAGHVHRPITAAFAGSVLTVAPSLWRQTGLLLNSDAPPGYLAEPTGFLLHMIEGDDCVTHTVQVSHAAALLGAY
ncbi:phosphodiesterase [Actinoplanes sp. NPDC004185]